MVEVINYMVIPGLVQKKNVVTQPEVNAHLVFDLYCKEAVKIIIDVVCQTYGISQKQFHFKIESTGKRPFGTRAEVVRARQLFCYILRTFYPHQLTYQKIGDYIWKNYNHSTVKHNVQQIQNALYSGELSVRELNRIKLSIDIRLKQLATNKLIIQTL